MYSVQHMKSPPKRLSLLKEKGHRCLTAFSNCRLRLARRWSDKLFAVRYCEPYNTWVQGSFSHRCAWRRYALLVPGCMCFLSVQPSRPWVSLGSRWGTLESQAPRLRRSLCLLHIVCHVRKYIYGRSPISSVLSLALYACGHASGCLRIPR